MKSLAFLLLSVIAVSHAVDFASLAKNPSLVKHSSDLNLKAKSKITKFLTDGPTNKASGPSARDEHWIKLRKDKITGEIPPQAYVDAQEFVKNMERAVTNPWTEIGPSTNKVDGGRTKSLLILPTTPHTIFAAAAAGGVWRSVDGGVSWTPLTDLLSNMAVSVIVRDAAGSIYFGTGEGFYNGDARRGAGIFKSTDGGNTFTQLPSTANSNFYYVNDIVISPTTAGRMYAATRIGFFVSTDSGTTWTALEGPTNLGYFDADAYSANGQDVLYLYEGNIGLHVSTDSGATWTQKIGGAASSTFFRGAIAIAPSNNQIGYCTQSDGAGEVRGLWKTTNGGNTWTQVLNTAATTAGYLNRVLFSNPIFSVNTGDGTNCFGQAPQATGQGWYDNCIAVHPTNPNTVWVGGVETFRSTDGGVNFQLVSSWWQDNTSPDYHHADHHSIVFSPNFANDNTIYFGGDGGVFKTSTPNGAGTTAPCNPAISVVYQPLNLGYATLQFYHGAVSRDGNSIVAGAQDNGSWKFVDCTTWVPINGGDGGYSAVDYNNPTRVYTSYVFMTIYRHDTGTDANVAILNNNLAGGGGQFINPYIMDPNNPKILYTANEFVWRSTDATAGNAGWTNLGRVSAAGTGGTVTAFAVDSSSTYLYVGTETGAIYRSTLPNGAVAARSAPCACTIGGLAVQPGAPNTVYAMIGSFGSPHLWRSTDGGLTWAQLGAGLPDIPMWDLFIWPSDPNVMYLGTDVGALYSSNGGQSWASVSAFGLANTPVLKFDYQPATDNLFAFTHGRGAYVAVVSGISAPPSSLCGPVNAVGTVQVSVLLTAIALTLSFF